MRETQTDSNKSPSDSNESQGNRRDDPEPFPHQSSEPHSPKDGSEFIFYGAIVESFLIVLALILGYLGLRDPDQTLLRMTWNETFQPAIVAGVIGIVPLIFYLWMVETLPFNPFSGVAEVTDRTLRPMFRGATLAELGLISLLAGLGEELLFRWSIQGGISYLIGGQSGIWIGLAAGSLLFGLCHLVNWSYAVLTVLIGLYFGALMEWTGTWLAPAIAHGLFDFIALCYLTDRLPIRRELSK